MGLNTLAMDADGSDDTNHQKQVLELFEIKLISSTTEIVTFLCSLLAA